MHKGIGNVLRKGLTYLIPLLLCLAFLLLGVLSKEEEKADARVNSGSIEVPFTRLAVENRLVGAELKWRQTIITDAEGSFAGRLRVQEENGEICSVHYELETLGDLSEMKTHPDYAALVKARERDAELVKTVYTAVAEALTPAAGLTRKQQERGLERLNGCLEADKTYEYTVKGWQFQFTSTSHAPMRTVTFTLTKGE